MKLTIRPLTADLWPALEDLFGENGACSGWTLVNRLTSQWVDRYIHMRLQPGVVPGPPPPSPYTT